ncbi:MAG: phosphoglycolate phosphatase [Rhodospirillales bacterium]
MAFNALLFDLDGTLIDSAPDLRAAANRVLAGHGRRPISLAEARAFIGDGAAMLVDRAFRATGVPAIDLAAETAAFLATYDGHETDETRPYPGVVETMRKLRAKGMAMAICTNKPERPTRNILKALDLAEFFDAVIGGDTVPGCKKPDPAPIQAALAALGSIGPACMIGDNANDLSAARAAGIPCVLVTGGYDKGQWDTLEPEARITDFFGLPAALESLHASGSSLEP